MLENFRIPIGEWGAVAVDWIRDNLKALLDVISTVVQTLVDGLADALNAPPAVVMIIVFALIAWVFRSWQLAVGTVLMFTVIVGVDQWETSMQTLALVLVAAIVTVIIAVPVGIWAARNNTVSAIVKPVLDFMQTMPSLVYLIPVIVFFGVGFVPGVIATVIFSLPPGVRLTELGIRGVDAETVEAGQAFGARPGQVLVGIQLPQAAPQPGHHAGTVDGGDRGYGRCRWSRQGGRRRAVDDQRRSGCRSRSGRRVDRRLLGPRHRRARNAERVPLVAPGHSLARPRHAESQRLSGTDCVH